jgi:hypothetical protein
VLLGEGRDFGQRETGLGQRRRDLVLDGAPGDGAPEMQDDGAGASMKKVSGMATMPQLIPLPARSSRPMAS